VPEGIVISLDPRLSEEQRAIVLATLDALLSQAAARAGVPPPVLRRVPDPTDLVRRARALELAEATHARLPCFSCCVGIVAGVLSSAVACAIGWLARG
jgi:hypothetical protein